MFLASIAFFLAFAVTRTITHLIHAGRGPFHDVVTKEGHLHHLVWGILLLLGVGYLWLAQVGTGDAAASPWSSRITALLFGVASALTLDEFALWLTFRDVYWEREGRLSIDAVLLFGALLHRHVGRPLPRGLALALEPRALRPSRRPGVNRSVESRRRKLGTAPPSWRFRSWRRPTSSRRASWSYARSAGRRSRRRRKSSGSRRRRSRGTGPSPWPGCSSAYAAKALHLPDRRAAALETPPVNNPRSFLEPNSIGADFVLTDAIRNFRSPGSLLSDVLQILTDCIGHTKASVETSCQPAVRL